MNDTKVKIFQLHALLCDLFRGVCGCYCDRWVSRLRNKASGNEWNSQAQKRSKSGFYSNVLKLHRMSL